MNAIGHRLAPRLRGWADQLAAAKPRAVLQLLLALAITNAAVFALMGVSTIATVSNGLTTLVL